MDKNYPEITRRISAELKKLRTDIPETMQGFSALAKAATSNGALDRKTKELIALAIGIATRCDGCRKQQELWKCNAFLGRVIVLRARNKARGGQRTTYEHSTQSQVPSASYEAPSPFVRSGQYSVLRTKHGVQQPGAWC